MATLDLKQQLKHLYAPSPKQVSLVDVPPLNYLMIDGKGDPNIAPRYQEAIESLYGLAYGIRAICKDAGNVFTVMPSEGLWWFEEQQQKPAPLTSDDKARFEWILMILQPDFVTAYRVEQAREQVREKKAPTALNDVRFESYHEGEAVQIMHIGSYNDEAPTVAKLHTYIEEQGWTLSGKHHEIYLSDPRKVAPEKMKTVIRQPFAR